MKNVIVVSVDDLRADHLSERLAPFIDKFAKESLLFKNAFSAAPFTKSSVASFFASDYACNLSNNSPLLAELFKSEGFATAAFTPNVQVAVNECATLGLERGFDKFELFLDRAAGKYASSFRFFKKLKNRLPSWLAFIFLKPFLVTFAKRRSIPNAEELNSAALSWIKQQTKPFFLWLFYMDVHEPFIPPTEKKQKKLFRLSRKRLFFPKFLKKKEKKLLHELYEKEVSYFDSRFEELINSLKQSGVYDDTLIVLTSDHGEGFGEHGFFGHPGFFYNELLKVPLIIHGVNSGVVERNVSSIDVAPTIANLFGFKHDFGGVDLLKDVDRDIIAVSSFDNSKFCCIRDGWKYIVKDNEELYNLVEDPREQNNVIEDNKVLAAELRSYVLSKIGVGCVEKSDPSTLMKERLEALGYLD